MAYVDLQYHNLSLNILEKGYEYLDESRNQICKQISSTTLELPLTTQFPLITTKKMFTKAIVGELLWFLKGDDNVQYLNDNGIHIWDRDAHAFSNKNGGNTSSQYVGRNYGVQWRTWSETININEEGTEFTYLDQIKNLIQNLKDKPMGRRHIVTAWNPAELHLTALPPCHWSFEIIVRPLELFETELFGGKWGFDLKWHQRSVDTFLGLPFNIASYALLAKIIEELTDYTALSIIGDLSNVHFYQPHIKIVKEQLSRNPYTHDGCNFLFSEYSKYLFFEFKHNIINLDTLFSNLKIEDFIFENYNSYESLKAEMYEPIN